MISLIKNIFSYFNQQNSIVENQKELEDKLNKLQEEEENETLQKFERKNPEEKQEILEQKCFRKIGIITSIKSNHGIIDKTLLFDFDRAAPNMQELKVGFRVEYLAYLTSNDEHIKVVKILQVLSEYWDEKPSDEAIGNELSELKYMEPEYFNTHRRSILGLIVQRKGNFITVDTDYSKMDIDLDTVSLEFVPQLGDRVCLNCNVQTDLSFIDSTGEILEIISIHPSRPKTIQTIVTRVSDTWGVINQDCFFDCEILENGYKPIEGDKVSADVIECDRGNFDWRCTKIIPLEKVAKITTFEPHNSDIGLYENKFGIMITDGIKFSFQQLFDCEEKEIIVTNDSDKAQKVLRSVFLGKKSQSQLKLLDPSLKDSFFINPGESRSFRLQGKAQFYGLSKEILVITFAAGFRIGRKIQIEVCVNNEDNKENNTSYKPNKRNGKYAYQVWSKKYDLVPGISVVNRPKFVSNRIGFYEVPERLKNAVLISSCKNEMIHNIEETFPSLSEGLSHYNYAHRFQTLLHLEEIEYFMNIRNYDRERAHFTKENDYLVLEIDNLAERRPSLVIGDSLKATNPWADTLDNRCFEGVIHKIRHNRILLKFNPGFHAQYNGEDYKIEFYFSRFGFRKQHYAIKKAIHQLGRDLLFSTKIKLNENIQLNASLNEDDELIIQNVSHKIKWFNPNLNSIQKVAIKNVLRGEARPMPYVIFGPPGTGKTVTIVETVLQIATLLPNSRILLGTPSNSSADLIATRLIGCEALQPGDFVRLVSHNLVEKELIPEHLKPYCATVDIATEGTAKDEMIITESGLKLKCQLKHLGRHKITIGTCPTLGSLLQLAFPKGHFTHVLIDEVGQCLEPEVMIPLVQVDRAGGQIILAGDPQQLGPIVLNNYALEKGLGTSFLVRLLNLIPYKKDKERFPDTGYDPRLVTKLIYNYRSLPSILNVFNELFYDAELISMIDEEDSTEIKLLRSLSDLLPNPETRPPSQAVFFVGIRGENRQDPDSPSWYNAAEAKSVFLFVMKLYKKQINPKSIGIITPYYKQVKAIRNIFSEADMVLPKIGSVEEFQGQERDIILISTVRSKKSLLQVDLRHALGFVQNSKRLNVAISRPRALLVIFGNPHLLSLDSCWEKLIKYCLQNDAYIGCDLPSYFL